MSHQSTMEKLEAIDRLRLAADPHAFDVVGPTSMGDALRYNEGKVPLSMVPRSLIMACARALQFGATKYARDNWRKGMRYNHVIDSLLRHILAYKDGEDADPESGLCHLDHVAANLAFLAEYRTTHPERDDRYKPDAIGGKP